MLAYKFLSRGGTGVLSGFRWPVGEWARRGRLMARVEGWTPALAAEFARVTIERRADIPGLLDDADRWDWDPPSAA
jgi:hypothetical protein